MSVATRVPRVAPSSGTTEPPDDAFPMPEGYLERLQTKSFTKNDLAWQAIATLQEPSYQETKLLDTATKHEAMAHAARKRAERLQVERGLADPFAGDDTRTWNDRLTAIGQIEIPEQQDLLLGYLHPTGHTIFFGDGDVGKGTVAAWIATRLARDLDHRVLIVDFEHNEAEWQPRLHSLGYVENGPIRYYDPAETPIWEQADDIAAAAKAMDATYVIVDSITFACMTDVSSGETHVVAQYKAALTAIALPPLSLAHIPKSGKEPHYPFGSIFWHNSARATWRLDHLEVEQEGGDQPSRKVTMTCCKRNDGYKPAKKILEILYSAGPVGLPLAIEETSYGETLATRFLAILRTAGAALTSSEVAKVYNDTMDPDDSTAKRLNAVSVGKEMRRHTKATPRKAAMFAQTDDKKWVPA